MKTIVCLVLLCDQNSFGRSKMVLVWPNWFGLDHNDLVTTKMKWSRPKWIGQVQIMIFYQNESHLVVTKLLWSSPNWFGQTKTILDRPKQFWSHRRTRHKWLDFIKSKGFPYAPTFKILSILYVRLTSLSPQPSQSIQELYNVLQTENFTYSKLELLLKSAALQHFRAFKHLNLTWIGTTPAKKSKD